ncbi:MAG: ABA4-like family protein [Sphingomonadaceae bacterium]|nr:ABA4-like family protein [Sphingomonadaceae bacterium]
MTLDTMFMLANAIGLVGWLALLFAPFNRSMLVTVARIAGVALCIFYVVAFAKTGLPQLPIDYSLVGIAAFFGVPGYVLAGWIHYLAFDLWIGSWEVEEAGRTAMAHWLVLPCLFFTYLLGPVGLLLFLVARATTAKRR